MRQLGPVLEESVLLQAAGMASQGSSTEEVLVFLKASGANAIASIRALQRVYGFSTSEAQLTLQESETWRSMR